ncbi:MAG: hypothetical protein IKU68_00820 [Oscillospiraceae bacterium]|nr:hypothetical protein [Oscillospiraceae bacterium]MBR5125253.1 hypothetical protein [Oscillospiraceae bacterium]
MAEEKEVLQEEIPQEEEKTKSLFQIQKESWYDKIPLNLKQMDIIVAVCWILLGITAVLIALEALGIFHLFG